MGILSKLFGGSGRSKLDRPSDKPPLYGGDGSTPSEAVVVNCASMSMANHLIDRFISERHGKNNGDWERTIELFVSEPNVPQFTIRSIGIECRDGSSHQYFFDISRPMGVTKNLAKMIGAWPKDVD